ncbi:MAG: DUF5054 domain-containing protein [Terracidiphilus sp.]|jgi:hypothetical protein
MKRRTFLNSLAGTTGLLLANSAPALGLIDLVPVGDAQIHRVLAVFKCHFDAGFVDTQAAIVKRYFEVFFPKAIATATSVSQGGPRKYAWTTGSWLLYEYLEQANTEQRRQMEAAIAAGYINWHALPFTWQTEMLSPSMISGSLALSQSLDRRFGQTTTGAKMTDVPGHTRGLIQPLAEAGVTFLDIGVNHASTPAILPPLFQWKDPAGHTLSVMYHSGYGGINVVPGSDAAIAIFVRGDNSGPHTPDEITQIFATLKTRFPNAKILPTNLTSVANELSRHSASLPVVTQEIGDTWIHGVGSDPLKVGRYRELSRLRERWISQGHFKAGDSTDVQLLRHVLLEVEHTWGTDTKTWLDFDHYLPNDLAAMLDTPHYKVVAFSWLEKRQDLFSGVEALPPTLRTEAKAAIDAIDHRKLNPIVSNLEITRDLTQDIETMHFVLKLDPKTGAIHRLHDKRSSREWASPDHPLALFSYQTYSEPDYNVFMKDYLIIPDAWARQDFGKPNIGKYGAVGRIWEPKLTHFEYAEDAAAHRLIAHLQIADPASLSSGIAAFPARIATEFILPKADPIVEINLYWESKPATRLPEAIWFTFNPVAPNAKGWTLHKAGQEISPFDVVDSGNRHMHAVSDGVSYKDGSGSLSLLTLDAPLVALGHRSALEFSRQQPDLAGGMHFNLFNNTWGTNYIMWYGEDAAFRFILRP